MSKQKSFLFSTVADILIWIFLIVFAIIVLVPLILCLLLLSCPKRYNVYTLSLDTQDFIHRELLAGIKRKRWKLYFVRNILNSF